MHAVADTSSLLVDGIINESQAREIERRGRDTMVALAVNSILVVGILATTGGLIFWLADALAVACVGALAIALGTVMARQGANIFSRAATLIGAGLLIGGGTVELMLNYKDIAGPVALLAGAAIALGSLWFSRKGGFVLGAIFLMGITSNLTGLAHIIDRADVSGPLLALVWLYATALIAGAGWKTDVRFVTALAIVPFAQALDTGTFYWHATYAFHSPESTLSILQMSSAIAICLWLSRNSSERNSRHLSIFALMAFTVANLCALVGSLWGDVVGQTVWGPGEFKHFEGGTYQDFRAIEDAFVANALTISDGVYSVIWAVALAGLIAWTALRGRRGLFNTTLTFALIHGYTQLFQSFNDAPFTYAIGGLAAIPLAWGIWRANQWISSTERQT